MTRPRRKFNKYFLTSVGAVSQIFALGNGGGVIGVLARNDHHVRHIPEALLWVASFAWITTLIDFIITVFGFTSTHVEAHLIYGLFVTVAYVVCTAFYGAYETFPVTHYNKGLLVLILAIGTIASYAVLTFWAGIELHEENTRKDASNKTDDEERSDNVFIEETKATEAPTQAPNSDELGPSAENTQLPPSSQTSV